MLQHPDSDHPQARTELQILYEMLKIAKGWGEGTVRIPTQSAEKDVDHMSSGLRRTYPAVRTHVSTPCRCSEKVPQFCGFTPEVSGPHIGIASLIYFLARNNFYGGEKFFWKRRSLWIYLRGLLFAENIP